MHTSQSFRLCEFPYTSYFTIINKSVSEKLNFTKIQCFVWTCLLVSLRASWMNKIENIVLYQDFRISSSDSVRLFEITIALPSSMLRSPTPNWKQTGDASLISSSPKLSPQIKSFVRRLVAYHFYNDNYHAIVPGFKWYIPQKEAHSNMGEVSTLIKFGTL